MPMISDENRREVALRLRGLDERIDGVPLLCTKQEHDAMALCAIRAVVGKGDVLHLLADFIDRPICKNIADPYDGGLFVCSKCGERWELTCGNLADNHLCFCPRCGAEVVPHAERCD